MELEELETKLSEVIDSVKELSAASVANDERLLELEDELAEFGDDDEEDEDYEGDDELFDRLDSLEDLVADALDSRDEDTPSDVILATDSMALDASGITESDGIISVPATVAKHMVQDYDGLKVLKPAEELEAAAKYADGIPVTRDHPNAGIVTDRGEVLGFLKDPLFENDELKGILQISNKDLATDIKDGKLKELSIGFFCNLDRTEGAVGDAKYDAIQKNIFLNHVAVVDAGRCSLEDGCGIHTDSPATKHTDDASAIATITAERDALNAELEKLRTDHLSFGRHGSGGKSAVDDAYAKVGR